MPNNGDAYIQIVEFYNLLIITYSLSNWGKTSDSIPIIISFFCNKIIN